MPHCSGTSAVERDRCARRSTPPRLSALPHATASAVRGNPKFWREVHACVCRDSGSRRRRSVWRLLRRHAFGLSASSAGRLRRIPAHRAGQLCVGVPVRVFATPPASRPAPGAHDEACMCRIDTLFLWPGIPDLMWVVLADLPAVPRLGAPQQRRLGSQRHWICLQGSTRSSRAVPGLCSAGFLSLRVG